MGMWLLGIAYTRWNKKEEKVERIYRYNAVHSSSLAPYLGGAREATPRFFAGGWGLGARKQGERSVKGRRDRGRSEGERKGRLSRNFIPLRERKMSLELRSQTEAVQNSARIAIASNSVSTWKTSRGGSYSVRN